MSDKKRTLILNVTMEWYDRIADRVAKAEDLKLFEYREIKEHWTKRLINKEYDFVEVRHAYSNDRPAMLFKWRGYRITRTDEKTDLGIGRFYAIDLAHFIKHLRETEFVEKANEVYECDGFKWIEEVDVRRRLEERPFPMNEEEIALLGEVEKHGGTIRKGAAYKKIYGLSCEGKPYVYRANLATHDLCERLGMFNEINGESIRIMKKELTSKSRGVGNILMLDVDGVLNIISDSYTTSEHSPLLIEPHLVGRINYLCKKIENLKIVISSSWRSDMKELERFLKSAGFRYWDRVIGRTTIAKEDKGLYRGERVYKWLRQNTCRPYTDHKVTNLFVIDDKPLGLKEYIKREEGDNWKDVFYEIDPKVGVTDETIKKIIKIANCKSY